MELLELVGLSADDGQAVSRHSCPVVSSNASVWLALLPRTRP